MDLVIVVDTEDESFKQCFNSIIQMFKDAALVEEILNAHFIING